MIAWIMVLEEPREDGRRLQEPDQRKRVLRQVQARQPVGVKVSIKPPRSRSHHVTRLSYLAETEPKTSTEDPRGSSGGGRPMGGPER